MQAITGNTGVRVIAALAAAAALIISAASFSASASGEATASRTVTVAMKNNFFSPKTVNISAGDRVVWSNSSTRLHTATKGGSFNVTVRPGKAAAVRFNNSGTYRYICTIHAGMNGKVVVD